MSQNWRATYLSSPTGRQRTDRSIPTVLSQGPTKSSQQNLFIKKIKKIKSWKISSKELPCTCTNHTATTKRQKATMHPIISNLITASRDVHYRKRISRATLKQLCVPLLTDAKESKSCNFAILQPNEKERALFSSLFLLLASLFYWYFSFLGSPSSLYWKSMRL